MNQDYIYNSVADKTLNKFSYRKYPVISETENSTVVSTKKEY